MPSVPADADALSFFPIRDVVADSVNAACDFVTGYARVLNARPETFFDQNVTVTNSARFYLHADLSGTWLRNIAFHQFKSPTGFTDLRRFHFVIHKLDQPFLSA